MKTVHCSTPVNAIDLSCRDNVETPASKHTPGPWKVMPCPQHKGKHPFHDHRWIATHDAEAEFGYDPRSWGLSSGSLICQMRDGPTANAHLVAAAPDLLAALKDAEFLLRKAGQIAGPMQDSFKRSAQDAREAIQRAEGKQ